MFTDTCTLPSVIFGLNTISRNRQSLLSVCLSLACENMFFSPVGMFYENCRATSLLPAPGSSMGLGVCRNGVKTWDRAENEDDGLLKM